MIIIIFPKVTDIEFHTFPLARIFNRFKLLLKFINLQIITVYFDTSNGNTITVLILTSAELRPVWPALIYSIAAYRCVELLLDRGGVDVNDVNQSGSSALHVAAAAGHVDCCQLMVSHGARLDTINNVSTVLLLLIFIKLRCSMY